MDLQSANDLCRLLGDPTRVRMLRVLSEESLSVAELTQVIGLAQSRVSTHLARLREANLVELRREGTTSYYFAQLEQAEPSVRTIWDSVSDPLRDPLLETDRTRARALVVARNTDASWSASIAGRMERYYSPGRTWQSAARAFVGVGTLGDVLDVASGDGALSELVAPHARSMVCLDVSAKVVAAGADRLERFAHVSFTEGDMHALPFEGPTFDQVLLLNALSYARDVDSVLTEACRVLRAGGRLVGTTLATHAHAAAVEPFGHRQLGQAPERLRETLEGQGLAVTQCEITHTERQTPHFEIITFHAHRA